MVIFTQTSFLFHPADSFLGTSEDDNDDDDIRFTISKINPDLKKLETSKIIHNVMLFVDVGCCHI